MKVKIKCKGSSEAKLSDLKIIQGNLKDLSEVNYEKLKGEILDLGFSAPFFCWTTLKGKKKKSIDLIDGTQRKRTLEKMQEEGIELPPKFPIIDVDADSYKQAKKKILAISSQYGTITQEGLIEFNKDLGLSLDDIQDSFQFDGLDFGELEAAFNGEQEQEEGEESSSESMSNLSQEQKDIINEAWRNWCLEINDSILALKKLKIFSQSYNQAYLKIQFLSALFTGKKINRSATLGYQYHRMLCSGDGKNGGSILSLINAVGNGEVNPERIRFALQERPSIEKLMTVSGIAMSGHKAPLDFPADLAKSLYNEFGNKGHILDQCHGWGGRYLGFALSECESYTGVDASNITSKGLVDMHNDLSVYHNKQAKFICSPFEDTKLKKDFYDFALTSPPYFDREVYIGGDQAHDRYKSYDDFIKGFYRKLIMKTYQSLKKKGVFCLQVGNQSYDLDVKAIEIAKNVGFKLSEIRDTKMSDVASEKETEIKEKILVFKK